MSLRMRSRAVASFVSAVSFACAMLLTPYAASADTPAVATDQVYVRAEPSAEAPILGEFHGGDKVTLTGYQENGFYEVRYGDYVGFAYMDFISTDGSSGDSAAAPEAKPTEDAKPAGNQSVVDYAMKFVGSPYVWAGADPSGFDCSGFTMYVVQNVLGYDITHSADTQATHGTAVDKASLQPGDLVFFTGTGASGYYSHVGIYIGNGQMVHAENESTGVVVSDINSDYYAGHYAYAVRL